MYLGYNFNSLIEFFGVYLWRGLSEQEVGLMRAIILKMGLITRFF